MWFQFFLFEILHKNKNVPMNSAYTNNCYFIVWKCLNKILRRIYCPLNMQDILIIYSLLKPGARNNYSCFSPGIYFISIFVSYLHATEHIPSFNILICTFCILTIQTRIHLRIIMRLIKIPVRIYYQVDLTTVSNNFKDRRDSNIQNLGEMRLFYLLRCLFSQFHVF